jgi:hypothetical protein
MENIDFARASVAVGCLVIAVPAFAKVIDALAQTIDAPAKPVYASTDAEMKAMQQKLEAIQNQPSQMTSGMVSQSSSSAGLPRHGLKGKPTK